MKTERLAGHHEARDALVLSVAGGDRDNAGREFDLDDFVLRPTVFRSGRIALAQLLVGGMRNRACFRICTSTTGVCAATEAAAKTCLQSIHSPYRVATEVQTRLKHSLSQNALGSPPRRPIVAASAARKDSKAVGSTQPTALPSSPIQCRYGIVGLPNRQR